MIKIVIIGMDIASYKTGWACFDLDNIRFKVGTINASGSTEERIRMIYHKSKQLFNTYDPSMIICESTYLDEARKHIANGTKKRGNINTLKILEKCHGAVIASTGDLVDVLYMAPNEHKELIAGIGHASKRATIWAIQKKLGVGNISDDEADAASLVLAHLMKKGQWELLEEFNKKFSK